MNLTELITTVICILILSAFIYVLIPIASQSSTSSYEVIDIKMYYDSGALLRAPSNGYIITCKDETEIITFDIDSDRMTIYETNISSNIIITTDFRGTAGELYWNQNQHSMQRL